MGGEVERIWGGETEQNISYEFSINKKLGGEAFPLLLLLLLGNPKAL